jgi:hypothetical protein
MRRKATLPASQQYQGESAHQIDSTMVIRGFATASC